MTLRSFLLRRILYTILLIFLVIIVNWLIFEGIPGQSGAAAFLTNNPRIAQNKQAVANLCALWKCNQSRTDQFLSYLHNMLTFQFGVSFQHGQSISTNILPALTLTLFTYGGFVLLTRATMLEALNEDYIVTAKAKGLSRRTILFHHAFKNASLPVVTSSALAFGGILAGAIITETVFAWNGLGFYLFQAVQVKDFPVMQAMFYLISLTVIAANFIADVLYGIIDPRIRYE